MRTYHNWRTARPILLAAGMLAALLWADWTPAEPDAAAAADADGSGWPTPAQLADLETWLSEAIRTRTDWAAAIRPDLDSAVYGPSAGETVDIVSELAAALAAVRQTTAAVSAWAAEWSPPTAGTADLVSRARTYTIERINCRDLRRDLERLLALMIRWRNLTGHQGAADLRQLTALLEEIRNRRDYGACIARLQSFRQELQRRERADREDPDAGTAENGTATLTAVAPASSSDGAKAGPNASELIAALQSILEPEGTPQPRPADGGTTADLLCRAQACAAARAERLQLQEQLSPLLHTTEHWLAATRLRVDTERRTLAAILEKLPTDVNVASDEAPAPRAVDDDLEAFEYYEVKEPQSLREISSLPHLYGTPDQWRRLQDANPGIAATPDEKLPVDTVLIVPRIGPVEHQAETGGGTP